MRKRTATQVDAARFAKRAGDDVYAGERLGEWNGQVVRAPADGYVENVLFDPHEHRLIITIVSTEESAVEQEDCASPAFDGEATQSE